MLLQEPRPAAPARPALCLFTDSREPSGVGAHMLALVRRLRGCYDLSLLCPPTRAGRRLAERAAALGAAVLTADALRVVPDWHRARDWLLERRTALLHVHAGVQWECLSAHHLARAAGVEALLRTEHLPFLLKSARDRAAYTVSLPFFDAIVAVSDGVRRSLLAAGVPPERVAAVPNGIEPPPPRDAPPPGPPVFLTVARLSAQKGHAALLRAAPAVLVGAPDARFRLVGAGPLGNQLRALAAELGIGHAVDFLGPRDDVPELLCNATAFVLPSRFEGLPLALLEAMGRGLPVVATDVCGSADAVEDGRTGLLVPGRNPLALAAAMLRVIDDPDAARAMGARARRAVLRDFSAARMAADTARHYDRLLAARAAPHTSKEAA